MSKEEFSAPLTTNAVSVRPTLLNVSGRWGLTAACEPVDALIAAAGAGWLAAAVLSHVHVTLELLQAPTLLVVVERSALGALRRELLLDGRQRACAGILSSQLASAALDYSSGDVTVTTEQRAGVWVECFSLLQRTLLEQRLTFRPHSGGVHVSARRLWRKLESRDEAAAGIEAERAAAALLLRSARGAIEPAAPEALHLQPPALEGMTSPVSPASAPPCAPAEEGVAPDPALGRTGQPSPDTGQPSPDLAAPAMSPLPASTPPLKPVVGARPLVAALRPYEPALAPDLSAAVEPAPVVRPDAFLAPAPVVAVAPVEEEEAAIIPNFSGSWAVDAVRSDSLDAVLTLMGVPWLARKVALALKIVTVIVHDTGSGAVETTERASVGVISTNSMRADGAAVSKKGTDGRTAVVSCSVWVPRDAAGGSRSDPPPIGCMRIVTELPDGLGVTDNVWTLLAGRRTMRQELKFTRSGSSTIARRVLINTAPVTPDATPTPLSSAKVPATPRMDAPQLRSAPASPAAASPAHPSPVADAAPAAPARASSPPLLPQVLPAHVQTLQQRPFPLLPSGGTATPPSCTGTPPPEVALPEPPLLSPPASSPAPSPGRDGVPPEDPFFVSLGGQWVVAGLRDASGSMPATPAAGGASPSPKATAAALGRSLAALHCPDALQRRLLAPQAASRLVLDVCVHTADAVCVVDGAFAGLGTLGHTLPLDGAWQVVRLPACPTGLRLPTGMVGSGGGGERAANARWTLARAVQLEGLRDLGPSWLGHEASSLPPATTAAAVGDVSAACVPVYSSLPFEPTRYSFAVVVVEVLLVELTREQVLAGSGDSIPASEAVSGTDAAPLACMPWRGGEQLPAAAVGRLVTTLRCSPYPHGPGSLLASAVRVVGGATPATPPRALPSYELPPVLEHPLLSRLHVSPEASRADVRAERSRVAYVRHAVLSRRAAADAARRAVALSS